MKRRLHVEWFFLALSLTSVAALAADGQVDIPDRVRGAKRVVVAKAAKVTPEWRTNAHGDRLIVSQVALDVEETMKGAAASRLWLDVEGGTIDGVTLVVSSLPSLRAGDRAIFLLDPTASGSHVPHLAGMGIMKLDAADRIQGTNLRRDDIRRLAANR